MAGEELLHQFIKTGRQFTLVQHGTDLVWHRSVLVCAGQLVRIVTV